MTHDNDNNDGGLTKEQWRQNPKEEALHIDPETAEVTWWWGQIDDPYGLAPEASGDCIGRIFFARSPGSMWVSFYDLPGAILTALQAKMERGEITDVLGEWPFD